VDKRQVLKDIVAQTQSGDWTAALATCKAAWDRFPEDSNLKSVLDQMLAREAARAAAQPGRAASAAADPEASSRAFLEEAVRRRRDREGGGADSMHAVMQSSRRISDVLHAAATRHMSDDAEALLSAARASLAQDLPQEALRLCQKVTLLDPGNEQVKALLKEIYQRMGL
jgi:hypothetical protein